mmetsp:Transcript_17987/g.17307  ORF Transcript_17987/g.17307 Transcript_17987/m.17307 type:complete len:397 (+) Transcript_17987:143-1333(+)
MFFSSVIFFFILIHLVAPIISLSALPEVATERPSRLRLDSFHDRESRFEDLYISITDMKENELDKRIAAAARLDPFLFVQFLLSTYVFINHIIEPLLLQKFRQRIRMQNLFTEISIHLFEIWLKIVTPKELSDQTGLFCDNKVVCDIRNDVMKIVGKREGQQVAYSILCLLNGSPNGCVLPLIIRDLSLLLKSIGLILLLCFPEIGKNKIYHRTYSKGSSKSINASEPSKQDTDQMEIHQLENEMKLNNSGSLIDVICEGISLIMETYILTYALTNLTKDKLNLFVLLKHIILGGLTFQYIGVVRGRSYGELLSSKLGTKTLESIQMNFRKLNDVISQLSLEHFISLFNGQKLQDFGETIDEIDTNHSTKKSKKNNATQISFSNKKGKKKKKKLSN